MLLILSVDLYSILFLRLIVGLRLSVFIYAIFGGGLIFGLKVGIMGQEQGICMMMRLGLGFGIFEVIFLRW